MRVPLSYIFFFPFLSFLLFRFPSPLSLFLFLLSFFVTRIDVFSAILRQDTHNFLSTSFESIESRIELSPLKIRRSREFDLDISIVRANDLYTFFRLDLENSPPLRPKHGRRDPYSNDSFDEFRESFARIRG